MGSGTGQYRPEQAGNKPVQARTGPYRPVQARTGPYRPVQACTGLYRIPSLEKTVVKNNVAGCNQYIPQIPCTPCPTCCIRLQFFSQQIFLGMGSRTGPYRPVQAGNKPVQARTGPFRPVQARPVPYPLVQASPRPFRLPPLEPTIYKNH